MAHRKEITEEMLLSIFRRINKKANALIDYEEFLEFMCLPHQKPSKLLKQYPRKADPNPKAKKPIIKPVVQFIENERRSKSPLFKDQKPGTPRSSVQDLHSSHKSVGQSPPRDKLASQKPKSALRDSSNSKAASSKKPRQQSPPNSKIQYASTSRLPQPSPYKHKSPDKPTRESSTKVKLISVYPKTDQKSVEKNGSSVLQQRRSEYKSRNNSPQSKPLESVASKPRQSPPRQSPPRQSVQRKLDYSSIKDSKHSAGSAKKQATPEPRKQLDLSVTFQSNQPIGSVRLSTAGKKPIANLNERMQEEKFSTSKESPQSDRRNEARDPDFSPPQDARRARRQERVAQADRYLEDSPSRRGLHDFIQHNSRKSLHTEQKETPDSLSTDRLLSNRLQEDRVGLFLETNDLSFSDLKHRGQQNPYVETPKFEEHASKPISFVTSLTQNDIKKFCATLKVILVISERIEELKNSIYKDRSFKMIEHFCSFDFENKGFLSLNEFSQLMNAFSIQLGRGELVDYLKCVLKKQFVSSDTRVTETDLSRCFAPMDERGGLMLFPHSTPDSSRTNYEVDPHVCAVLEKVVQLQIKMHEEIKSCLKEVNYLARRNLYQHLCSGGEGPVQAQALSAFLKANGVRFYQADVLFLFREFNSRSPQSITEDEFLTFFKVYSGS